MWLTAKEYIIRNKHGVATMKKSCKAIQRLIDVVKNKTKLVFTRFISEGGHVVRIEA